MSYVRGEEKITRTVEDAVMVDACYRLLHTASGGIRNRLNPNAITHGSTRFDSHGYVSFPLGVTVSLWRAQRLFPKIEFRLGTGDHYLTVAFRTVGSTGWHGL